MNEPPFNKIYPGSKPSAAQLNRLADVARRSSHVIGNNSITDGTGTTIQGYEPNWVYAKITAKDAGTPQKYSWSQVWPDGLGGWTVLTGGAAGTTTSLPAYEANGTDVAINTYHLLYYGSDNAMWFYSGSGGSSSEVPTYKSWTGNQNDVVLSSSDFWIIVTANSPDPLTVTGFHQGVTGTDGRKLRVTNLGPAAIRIPYNDAGSLSQNRIYTPDSLSYTLDPLESCDLQWEGNQVGVNKWRIIDRVLPALDGKVKVSSDDTTPDFLENKITAGTATSVTVINNGADEEIVIGSTQTGTATALPYWLTTTVLEDSPLARETPTSIRLANSLSAPAVIYMGYIHTSARISSYDYGTAYSTLELYTSRDDASTQLRFTLDPSGHQFVGTTNLTSYPAIVLNKSGGSVTGVTGSYTNASITVTSGLVTSASSGSVGITTLNGLTGDPQTFVNDTNVTIVSSGTTHTLTWAGTLAVARGGTGASTESTARASLGLAIGTDVQAWDFLLQDIADLADPNADRILFWDDSASGGSGDVTWLTIGSGLEITGTTLNAGSSVAGWIKVTKSYADFSTAATSNTITAHVLPAKGYVQAIVLKHSTAFSGGGSTSYVLDVGYTGTQSYWVTAFDVFQAVSNTAFSNGTNSLFSPPGTNITLTANSDANLNLITAGSVDLWILVSTLP